MKALIIAVAVAAILVTASASAHVPERCEPLAEEHGAAWTKTHQVLRELFIFALCMRPGDPANPVPTFEQLLDETEAARQAEIDALLAYGKCVNAQNDWEETVKHKGPFT